jgi:superfamily II DNA/RNA helicase
MSEVNIEDLAQYSSEEEDNIELGGEEEKEKTKKKDIHIAVHDSGFNDMLLKKELLRAIGDCGFEHPSEVQHECIPQANLGSDVLCQAKSGMGKTAVFVLSILHQIDESDSGKVQCLVLCHARELAYQIQQEFKRFTKYLPTIKTHVVFGGTPIIQDRRELTENTPHILIGTPGRVLHLLGEGTLDLSHVKYFILDECDQMLEVLDMRTDVQKIYRKTPHNKQVMMFSATMPEEIRSVCKRFMHEPFEICINDGSKLALHGLQQYYVQLEEGKKNRKLVDLLDALDFNQVVIFVRSVQRCETLNKILNDQSFPSIAVYGGYGSRRMNQQERLDKFQKFKQFGARIMVATNLFGRGVDFERVNVVINYDMAEDEKMYLHRVGRAGRFGTKGLAISFITNSEDEMVLEKVKRLLSLPIPPLPDEIDPSTYMTN